MHTVLLLLASVSLAAAQPLETLSPFRIIRVPLKSGQKVREFVAADDGFRFLVQSSDGEFQLLSTGGDGQPKAEFNLGAKMATGLVLTPTGLATVAVKNRKPFLIQFDPMGSVASESPLDCFGVDFLLAISGNPATVCGDGGIVEHRPNGGLDRRASWIRPGSAAEILGDRTAVIIDRSTAEMAIHDLESGRLSLVKRIPEIDKIVKETHAKYESAGIEGSPNGAPIGKPVVIMDTAQEPPLWYVLVWPYHPSTGVLVASFSMAGEPVKKMRCQVPGEGSGVHRMDVRGDTLYLASIAGDVFQYTIR